jgi:hypothetical protein
MMLLLVIVCSLLPMAIGLALLITAPPAEEHEPTPAELSLSRPVVRPLHVRACTRVAAMRRAAVRLWVRPQRIRTGTVRVVADVTAAHTILGGRVADLWSISDSHRPLPCR